MNKFQIAIVPQFGANKPIVTGLEWEDPMHVNRLSISEERRLNILLTKIASVVNMKKMILRPYFQDYELVSDLSILLTANSITNLRCQKIMEQ